MSEDKKQAVELWGEHGPELLVVSDTPPEHVEPGRIWIQPYNTYGDPEYWRRFRADGERARELMRQTAYGQYERFTEEAFELIGRMVEAIRPLLDLIAAQIRDFFAVLADAAEWLNDWLDERGR